MKKIKNYIKRVFMAKNELLEKIKKAGSIKNVEVLSKSSYFNDREFITTKLPALNIALSGELSGGLSTSITTISGDSKTFKTLISLFMVASYLDKHKDGFCLFYDNEFGTTKSYIKSVGIDTERVIHIPVRYIEEMKFDMVKRLEQIERNDKVIIFIDSIGSMPSLKEIEDAEEEKAVADMQRSKAIRSLMRLLHSNVSVKDIPAILIAHVYKTMELYSKSVVGGGTSIQYFSNNVWIITKAQEKDGDELAGYKFTINIDKSRFVKEKSKIPFTVLYNGGIQKYSSLLDIALDSGHVIKPVKGWFSRVNLETGEVEDKKYREKDTNNKDFWISILESQSFDEYIKSTYKLPDIDAFSKEELSEELNKIYGEDDE